jgi:hypothetical protein
MKIVCKRKYLFREVGIALFDRERGNGRAWGFCAKKFAHWHCESVNGKRFAGFVWWVGGGRLLGIGHTCQ